MIFSCLSLFASARQNTTNDPVIYLRGDGGKIYAADGVTEVRKDLDKSKLVDMVKSVIFPYFVNCITGGTDDDWNAYYDKFAEVLHTVYEDWALNDDGEVVDGSGIGNIGVSENKRTSGSDNVGYGNSYSAWERLFYYDVRRDPFENVVLLHDYIEDVKKSTGHDKVSIYSACMGSSLGLTYLAEYGWDDISAIMFDSPTVLGQTSFVGMATGSIDLDGATIQRALDDVDANSKAGIDTIRGMSIDPVLAEFLKTTVEILNQYHIIDLMNGGLKPFINRINHGLVPELLMASYGTCPNYWAQVGDENFEKAIKNTFGVRDYTTRYAKLIEKLNRFHDEVSSKAYDLVRGAMADGVNVGFIAKYGYSAMPVYGEITKELGEDRAICRYASFGATCGTADKTLSKQYIEKQNEKGLGKYISCDNLIDASTCISPDKTWFLKGGPHKAFSATNPLTQEFFNRNGNLTVNDLEKYPQYLIIDKSTYTNPDDCSCIPMTTENMNDTNWEVGKKKDFDSPKSFVNALTDWIVSFIKFFKNIFTYIQNLFNKILKK